MLKGKPAIRLASLLVALLFSAGAQAQGVAGEATTWVLQKGRDIPARPPRTPKLRLEGQKLSGSTGCNSFTATLSEKPDKRVAIEQVALTRMLCAPAQNRIEKAFVAALSRTEYIEHKGKRLTFLSGKRRPLLVWTRNPKSGAGPSARRKHYARVNHHQRVVRRSCWDWWTSAGGKRARF